MKTNLKASVKRGAARSVSLALVALLGTGLFAACEKGGKKNLSEFTTYAHEAASIEYEDVAAYEGEVMDGAESNQKNVKNGMIVSPYLTCTVNGREVTVYATRCTTGAHSFAYVDVTGDGDIRLEIELTLARTRNSVVVLPESKGVKATLDSSKTKVNAVVEDTGSFSFAFDRKEERGFTLIVKRAAVPDFPDDYAVRYFDPGTYTAAETTFTDEKTVYYFRTGDYEIDGISLPSNSILYSDYAYFRIGKESTQSALRSQNTSDVKVLGRSIYDFSDINMETDGKGTFGYTSVGDFVFEGITCIDSCGWTFCFTNCENGEISNITGLGYRTFTDGIMIANSNHMRVYDCFMRTGDDAFEVKSTGVGEAGDVVFENCHAWNDKAVAFGVIYEMNYAVYDVHFNDCSVGFNMPTWDVTRAAASVCMFDYHQGLTNRDIYFDNFEVYYSMCPIISLCLHNGTLDNIRFSNFTLARNMTEYPVYIKYSQDYIGGTSSTDEWLCKIESVYFDNISVEGQALTFGQIKNVDYPERLYIDGVEYAK